jgi:hypothetical protein
MNRNAHPSGGSDENRCALCSHPEAEVFDRDLTLRRQTQADVARMVGVHPSTVSRRVGRPVAARRAGVLAFAAHIPQYGRPYVPYGRWSGPQGSFDELDHGLTAKEIRLNIPCFRYQRISVGSSGLPIPKRHSFNLVSASSSLNPLIRLSKYADSQFSSSAPGPVPIEPITAR